MDWFCITASFIQKPKIRAACKLFLILYCQVLDYYYYYCCYFKLISLLQQNRPEPLEKPREPAWTLAPFSRMSVLTADVWLPASVFQGIGPARLLFSTEFPRALRCKRFLAPANGMRCMYNTPNFGLISRAFEAPRNGLRSPMNRFGSRLGEI